MGLVVVKINGTEYNLKGHDNEDYLKKIAEYIDSKIKAVCDKNSKLSYNSAAVLAAMNVADELFNSKDEIKNLQSGKVELEKKYRTLEGENSKVKEELMEMNQEVLTLSENNSKELMEKLEEYKLQVERLEKQYEKSQKLNKALLERNKDVNFQLNNYKYKVLDLERKYMDINLNLARAKNQQNVLLKAKKYK